MLINSQTGKASIGGTALGDNWAKCRSVGESLSLGGFFCSIAEGHNFIIRLLEQEDCLVIYKR